MSNNKIELAIVEVVKVERFYAEMLGRMRRKVDNTIDTLRVGIGLEGPYVTYNEHFIEQFPVELDPLKNGIGPVGTILKHEAEHLLRDHVGERRKNIEPDLFNQADPKAQAKAITKIKLIQLAEDLEINQNLPRLPKQFSIFDKEGKALLDKETGKELVFTTPQVQDYIKQYPLMGIKTGQTSEYYYEILKLIVDKGGNPLDDGQGNPVATIDDHNGDPSTGSLDPEMVKQMVAQLVNESYEALSSQEKGKLPANLIQLIQELNKKTLNWRQQLRQFKTSCSTMEVEETRRRRNRRYGLLYPGRRPKNKLHLVVAVDSSGSVYDEALTQFFSEIAVIEKAGAKVTVIECDSQIGNVYKFDPKKKIAVKGRGGTSFKPVFDLVASSEFIKKYGKPDGLAYFTDGEDWGDVANKPKCKMLWVLLPGCKVKYNWGERIFVEVENERKRAY